MAARTGIVVGIALIAGGIAWFALRDGGSSPDDAGKSAPETTVTRGRGGALTPSGATAAGPARSGKLDVGGTARPTDLSPPPPQSGARWQDQDRDPEWAPGVEADIKHRFATGVRGATLVSADCRHDQCLVTMSAPEADMGKAMADVESPGGLLGFADHIIWDGPETREGAIIIKGYVVFDRRASDENPTN